jgi:hypothetical protein
MSAAFFVLYVKNPDIPLALNIDCCEGWKPRGWSSTDDILNSMRD